MTIQCYLCDEQNLTCEICGFDFEVGERIRCASYSKHIHLDCSGSITEVVLESVE